MTICTHQHRYDESLARLPHDQGGIGRHKCSGCAYDQGYALGLTRTCRASLDLNTLPFSQAGVVRHKSPHAAFADGYSDGVRDSYSKAG